jgi:hypothetical protein
MAARATEATAGGKGQLARHCNRSLKYGHDKAPCRELDRAMAMKDSGKGKGGKGVYDFERTEQKNKTARPNASSVADDEWWFGLCGHSTGPMKTSTKESQATSKRAS